MSEMVTMPESVQSMRVRRPRDKQRTIVVEPATQRPMVVIDWSNIPENTKALNIGFVWERV